VKRKEKKKEKGIRWRKKTGKNEIRILDKPRRK